MQDEKRIEPYWLMIDDIKNGRINLVVAMKVDRLTREGYDGQWFLKFCKENNCGLILSTTPLLKG